MNYIEINYNEVDGFTLLTKEQQTLFISTYKRHNSGVGHEYKEDFTPVKVEWVKEKPDLYSYLKVTLQNGDWLHYTQKGEWY